MSDVIRANRTREVAVRARTASHPDAVVPVVSGVAAVETPGASRESQVTT